MISYDPRGHTWNSWCALMAEKYASNQLGTLPEERWRDWADGLVGIGLFTQAGTPDHRIFSTWQDWASALCGIL